MNETKLQKINDKNVEYDMERNSLSSKGTFVASWKVVEKLHQLYCILSNYTSVYTIRSVLKRLTGIILSNEGRKSVEQTDEV